MKQGDAINAADDLNRYAEAGSFFYAKRISNDDWYVEHHSVTQAVTISRAYRKLGLTRDS